MLNQRSASSAHRLRQGWIQLLLVLRLHGRSGMQFQELKPLLNKFNNVADSLQAARIGQTLQEAGKAIQSLQKVVSKLEQGQGSAGKFLTSDSLYNGLNKSLLDLDKLLIDFRTQPKRYIHFSVFGKKDPKSVTQ